MKYIDAKKFAMLVADFQSGYTAIKDIETHETLESVLAMIDEFPAADVVEVVRCKDCILSKPNDGELFQSARYCTRLFGTEDESVWNDGFCSYGKRKEE